MTDAAVNNAHQAPPPSTPAVLHEFQQIPLALITPSKTNPRKQFEGPEFDELVADIRVRGVLFPVLVRPIHYDCMSGDPIAAASQPDGFELIAGERRYRASLAAGRADIPARVQAMTDAQALEAQMVENLQRKDLQPLEEARGYRELLDVMAAEDPTAKREDLVKQLATRVSKSVRTVYACMKLTELVPEAQKALEEGRITASHGDLLVRLQPADQKTIFEKNLFWTDDIAGEKIENVTSVRELKSTIAHEFQTSLDKAPWNLSDEKLVPKVGSCAACPKNTAHDGDPDASCTDRACFKAKREAYIHSQIASAKALTGKAPLHLAGTYSRSEYKDAIWPGEWKAAKGGNGSCAHVQAGVVIDGAEAGKIVWVCRNRECSVHYPQAQAKKSAAAKSDPKAEAKRKEEQAKREAEEKVARERECAPDRAVFRAVMGKITGSLTEVEFGVIAKVLTHGQSLAGDASDEAVAELARMFDFENLRTDSGVFPYDVIDQVWEKKASKWPLAQRAKFLLAALMCESIAYDYGNFSDKDLDAVAKQFKLDPKTIRAKTKEEIEAKQKDDAAKVQTPAKPALTPAQLAALKPEPKVRTPKKPKPAAKKPAKKSAKKGGR